jgi:hypothetical protein
MIVRTMRTDEIDSVVTLFNYYREAADISEDTYDENKVLNTIREYNIRPNLFFRIALDGQRPVGVIGGFASEDPVDTDFFATIQFCYLIDSHNNIDNYEHLIQEFEAWAKNIRARAVRVLDIGRNLTRLSDVYDQLGYNRMPVTIMNKEIQ